MKTNNFVVQTVQSYEERGGDARTEIAILGVARTLEKACKMANSLVWDIAAGYPRGTRNNPENSAADLHYMLEYLRLNFDLVPKK